jgi:hypothetical protein
MITLTYDEAVALLNRAVQEKGEDYVYEMPDGIDGQCMYVVDGAPSCIIGHVYAYAGGDLELLHQCEGVGASVLRDQGVLFADERTLGLLRRAQMRQDSGDSWGVAVEVAIRVHPAPVKS